MADDDDFLRAFENLEMPKASFRHEEHLRVAWAVLRTEPLISAIQRVSSALKRFVVFHDVATEYHETITWMMVLLVNERRRRDPIAAQSWGAFRLANGDLLRWDNGKLLEPYYDETVLWSDEARQTFVLPRPRLE